MKKQMKLLLCEAESRLERYNLDEEQISILSEYFRNLAGNDELLCRAIQYYNEIYSRETSAFSVEKYEEGDGIESGMLFAAIYYIRCELLKSILAERGIPANAVEKVPWHYRDLFTRNKRCYGKHGFCGMYRNGMIRYTYPRSYTLGRLCFEMTTFFGPYELYRNKKDSSLVPLALPDFRYLPDGRQAPRNYEGSCFVTQLSVGETVIGNTFNEDGTLNFTSVNLDMAEYEKVLFKGVPVLSVHIPGNDKLTPESVDESFKTALGFFKEYYPDIDFKAFICSSWLLDPNLKQHLNSNSNILNFQTRFRTMLSAVNDFSLYWNIFGIENFIPRNELVPTNSFQRSILKMLDNGGRMYSGNGFILI